ncbi:MAG: fatty acid desaturase, partial [Myxococcota bacterium]
MSVLPFYVSFTLAGTFVLAALYGGPFLALTPLVAFVGIPLVDAVLGQDERDPTDGPQGRRPLYDLALWLWVPVQLAVIALGIWRIDQGVSFGEAAALVFSLGIVSAGGGINVAHELMHRKPKLEQGMAEVLMTAVSYPWFCVEHILGHHRFVATPDDPATARLGQTIYSFVPQSIFGGLASAWRLEGERVARRGIAGTWADRRVRHTVLLVGTYVLVGALAGGAG